MTEQQKFLSVQLDQHACAICYDLMLPPDKAPFLLFPCGHSFCKVCLENHTKKTGKTCPLCRAKIQSQALNFSLQQLILSLSAKNKELSKTASSPKKSDAKTLTEALSGEHATEVQKYWSEFRMYSLRCKVLSNKVVDLKESLPKLAADRLAAELVVTHLKEDEEQLLAKLAALELELSLVRKELAAQRTKTEQLAQSEESAVKSAALIEQTILPLARERDKARLLLKKLCPDVPLEED